MYSSSELSTKTTRRSAVAEKPRDADAPYLEIFLRIIRHKSQQVYNTFVKALSVVLAQIV